MEAIISGINWLDDFIWGMPMIVLLLGTHLFMTVRTGFIQRKTFTGIRLSVRKDPEAPGDVSQFQALTTALASTILGWSYYGERCAQYLWGKRALLPYKLVFVAVVVVGPVLALDLVWTIADILNALMAIPNLVAVLLLSGVVARETRHYLGNLDEVDQTEIPRVDK